MPNFADRNSKAAITLMFTSLTDFSWEHFIEHCFFRHLDYYYLWFSVTNWTKGNKTETCSWPVFSFENCCILTLIEEPIYLRLKEPECEKFSFLSEQIHNNFSSLQRIQSSMNNRKPSGKTVFSTGKSNFCTKAKKYDQQNYSMYIIIGFFMSPPALSVNPCPCVSARVFENWFSSVSSP